MNQIDKMIKNIIGTPRKRGGKNDWDFDSVPNRRDCQPRNTMRQDKVRIVHENIEVEPKYAKYVALINQMNKVVVEDPLVRRYEAEQSLSKSYDRNWVFSFRNAKINALRGKGYSDRDINMYMQQMDGATAQTVYKYMKSSVADLDKWSKSKKHRKDVEWMNKELGIEGVDY